MNGGAFLGAILLLIGGFLVVWALTQFGILKGTQAQGKTG